VHAAEAVLGVARRVKQWGLPPHTFINVNVPAGEPRGTQVVTQAMSAGGDESFAEAKHPNGRTYYWNVYKEGGAGEPGTDVWAVANGYVAVTAMRVGETDPKLQETIKGWFK
jgi:5'-nucleotidase